MDRPKRMHVMLRTNLEMPMRSRIDKTRLYTDYRQAAGMLRHDLVWSDDFEVIRGDLADLIQRFIDSDIYPEPMTAIVQKLIADENDLSI
jgi:spore coat polysaccharide biosynthesis protein SpsF (cytidylyltransferase family)